MTSIMDNDQLQQDEVEALSAIYGDDWVVDDGSDKGYSIVLKNSSTSEESLGWTKTITMEVRLPPDYPLESPPLYTLSAPWMSRIDKVKLMNSLEEIYCEHAGENILYMWIEKAREFFETNTAPEKGENQDDKVNLEVNSNNEETKTDVEIEHYKHHHHQKENQESLISLFHGEPIMDRRSAFQAHVAVVYCVEQVKETTELLKANKKIASATHNITAYRISGGPHNTFLQDCDDDGEAHAGARLLHLLQILDVRDVFVMVSRWYGGIQLGPDRFKHINNVARDLLDKCGLLEASAQDIVQSGKMKKKSK